MTNDSPPEMESEKSSMDGSDSAPAENKWPLVLLWTTIVCLLATLLTTWPLWQIRTQAESPPNVPLLGFLRQLPAHWLLIIGLATIMFRPKIGFWIFTAAYALAVAADLSRLQPQMFGLLILLAATVSPAGRKLAFWFLIAMWLWAGIHKIVSPYWMGPTAFTVLDRMGIGLAREIHIAFAWTVAIVEIVLAVLVFLRWRWAWCLCAAVHLGIAGMLVAMNWNFAVLYWNLAIAIVGTWIVFSDACSIRRQLEKNQTGNGPRRFAVLFPTHLGIQVWALAMMVLPAGFYFGWTPHCLSHALYSDNLPKATITTTDRQASAIDTWTTLFAPVPSERWYYQRYFDEVAKVGDKMHILDSRSKLKDLYVYRLGKDRSTMMTVEEFFSPIIGVGKGRAHEYAPAIYQFEKRNCVMHRASKTGPIHSLKIPPDQFEVALMDHLRGLQNLEIVDLSGTTVSNRELSKLNRLKNLRIILLNHTDVTDAGVERLNGLKRLELISREGTELSLDAVVNAILRNTR